jgi:hypothetical protein
MNTSCAVVVINFPLQWFVSSDSPVWYCDEDTLLGVAGVGARVDALYEDDGVVIR